jgi:hypothetical protein
MGQTGLFDEDTRVELLEGDVTDGVAVDDMLGLPG